jgi:beta-phosphoglucomutase
MGVGSSSKNAPFILDKLGLVSRFASVIDGNGVKNTKPDPEVFLNAAHQLQVLPENCLVVEDAPSGIQAAKAAGMKVVGVGHDLAEADLCVSSLVGLGWDQIQNL